MKMMEDRGPSGGGYSSRSDGMTVTAGFSPPLRSPTCAFVAERRLSRQASLRDAVWFSGPFHPWVETHGYRQASLRDGRRGFTLVELLVVIAIIVLLAGMALGAMSKAREVGKLDATKATVAKLDSLVMKRYESYRTRRVPMSFSGADNLLQTAFVRLSAIRALMLMEMPQCWADITNPPQFSIQLVKNNGQKIGQPQNLNRPSLSLVYLAKYNTITNNGANKPAADHQQAKCLYLWVMTAMPEAKALFRPEEINKNIDGDNWPVFVDGWGKPIGFLRWAPGASAWSDIQIADPVNHHDPFDPMLTQNGANSYAFTNYQFQNPAYDLKPLIFAGVLSKNASGLDDYGITLTTGWTGSTPVVDPYNATIYGSGGAIAANGGVPKVTNHHLEQK